MIKKKENSDTYVYDVPWHRLWRDRPGAALIA